MNIEGAGNSNQTSYDYVYDLVTSMIFVCAVSITIMLAIFYRVARTCLDETKTEEGQVRPPSERQYLMFDSEASKPNEDWNSTI